MTMILAVHLGDCILIAADRRAMSYDLTTHTMQHAHDHEVKIKSWCRGAIAGTGETVFINRVIDYFLKIPAHQQNIQPIQAISHEIKKRSLEGVPTTLLHNNHLVFSIFNGVQTALYSISIAAFFHTHTQQGQQYAQPDLHEIKAQKVELSCFNLPTDMRHLQAFQHQLKALQSFSRLQDFIDYYANNLKSIFAIHAAQDHSISRAFDLYLQVCSTGQSFALHIANHIES